jgi:predicted metal-dependent hydrolase
MTEHVVAGRPVAVVRHPAARRMKLGVDPRNGMIRLTLPSRASLSAALDWAGHQQAWIEKQLDRLAIPRPIVPGMTVPLAGEDLILDWSADRSRRVYREEGRLVTGGPEAGLANRVLRHLQREALALLTQESIALSNAHNIPLGTIGIGDPGTRWGSCSVDGNIRYSWRLLLAPADVRRATVAHEVAHCVHMNHGAAFHALVRELHGADPTPARRWLKTHGASLHWFGRE